MSSKAKLKSMGFLSSFSIFVTASFAMFFSTKFLIPWLTKVTGMEIILFWFLVAGLGIFLPLLITAFFILKSEGYSISKETWRNRLRFKKLTKKDWIWIIGGMVVIMILSALFMNATEFVFGEFDHSPPFMSFDPLTTGRYWLLLVWFPYWILNILGEEILWRGVMFPRQELAFGKYTWLIHGFGWGLFHIAFGWQLLVTLLPILFIQSYVVQKTKNSWSGVIIHGAINGPSFIAIALGFI